MNLHDDPGTLFRDHMPDITPPPAAFDLDKIVRDGYKARRRHRAVLGGASATSVAAIASVLALSVGVLPNGAADEEDDSNIPTASADFDYANAGYPWPGDDGFGDEAVAAQLTEAGREAFSDLLISTGRFQESDFRSVMNEPTEEEIAQYAAEMQVSVEQAEAELSYVEDDGLFVFSGHTTPGNYGQVQLYGYRAWALAAQDENAEGFSHHLLDVEVLLPGGWTAEPGPTSQQYFPQHLVDDDADSFESTDLGDGRTLYTVQDGCRLTYAVTYQNHAALRATWDGGCATGDGDPIAVDAEAFKDAVVAMPQIDYDTDALVEVDDVLDVPTGWLESDRAWEEWAADGALSTREQVAASLAENTPGAVVGEPSILPSAEVWDYVDPDAVTLHRYRMNGTLPFSTVIDSTTDDASFDLTYTLPGGWLPGFNEAGQRGPYLSDCREDFGCSTLEVNGRTAYIAEKRLTHEADEESGATEDWFEGEYEITVVDPDGWAVTIWTQFGNEDFELSAEDLAGIVAQLPAPTYDADLEPVLGD
ncbi:hypothetical protein [Glycomyces dulcitolivorans]|uniref:hypothetical protein n=1 Tax=Glycomyces dulcitolivorans TaxID=2200759 RepID=UPI000DD30F4B|nr:hypothetical protein [Glycomyces dulcitolivorans]